MVEIKNLSFSYKAERPVFENLSLLLKNGKIYGLLGKNGTGKSTLLHIISGLLHPKTGTALFNGINVKEHRIETQSNIFIVPEEFQLPNITLKRYTEITAPFYPKFNMDDFEKYMQIFNISADTKLEELSMGAKKKAFISFALATNTQLLILDEPTNGLDISSKSQFRKAISMAMNDERMIIISTHQIGDIENLLEHIIIIEENDILVNNSTDEICEKFYFGATENIVNDTNIIYSQPSPQGNLTIQANREKRDSPLNIEILFNAAHAQKEKITDILNK